MMTLPGCADRIQPVRYAAVSIQPLDPSVEEPCANPQPTRSHRLLVERLYRALVECDGKLAQATASYDAVRAELSGGARR